MLNSSGESLLVLVPTYGTRFNTSPLLQCGSSLLKLPGTFPLLK